MQTQWLIPLDGSEHALRALDAAVLEAQARSVKPALVLLHVQSPLSSDVSRFIDAKTIDEDHREAGEKVLQPARDKLDSSGLTYTAHIMVGEVAPTIAAFGTSKGCQMVVMGARGMGSALGLLMGSVSAKVIHQTPLNVMLVH
jgi:nucleotide-binding universal stress UspA family protein